jgi:predicted MPP superfamily phosphohydrolase
MVNFRFIHAADLHLDSPLIGLAKKSEDRAARLDDASRRAFDNLVGLAIEEDCRLIVIAGDIFDGQWRDYRTGLFFANRMLRLSQADIRVIIIAGNHDAENRFANRLEYSDNVKLLSTGFRSPWRSTNWGRSFMDEVFRSATPATYGSKVEVRTSPAAALNVDPTIAGKLRQAVECLAADPWLAERLEARLARIKIKLPAGAQSDALFRRAENGSARECAHWLWP